MRLAIIQRIFRSLSPSSSGSLSLLAASDTGTKKAEVALRFFVKKRSDDFLEHVGSGELEGLVVVAVHGNVLVEKGEV